MMNTLNAALIGLIILQFISIDSQCARKNFTMNDADETALIVIRKEDNGKTFEVKKGEVFIIELEGNPTTGYIWKMTEPKDNDIIELIDKKFNADSERIGSPGIRTFHFKAVGRGKTMIQLVYHRPWEKKTPPHKQFKIEIQIKNRH